MARSFNGSSSYVQATTRVGPSAWTVCAWIRPLSNGSDATFGGRIYSVQQGTNPWPSVWQLSLRNTAGTGGVSQIYAWHNTTGTDVDATSVAGTLRRDRWQFVCGVMAGIGSTPHLYYGDPDQPCREPEYLYQISGSGSSTGTPNRTAVGANGAISAYWFDGSIAHVGMWTRALTRVEVELFRQATLRAGQGVAALPGVLAANLESYYPLNEPSNSTAFDRTGTRHLSAVAATRAAVSPQLLVSTWIGRAAGGPTTYYQAAAGTVTPAAVIARQTGKPLAASTTPAASLSRQTAKPLAGTTTPAAVLRRQTGKAVAGTATPAGSLVRALGRSLAGSVTPAGALARSLARTLTGGTTPAGGLVRRTSKSLSGTATPSGAVAALKSILLALAGTVTPSGGLLRRPGKALTGGTTPAGSVARQARKTVTGTTSPAGGVVRSTAKAVAGTVTSSGAVAAIRTFLRTLTSTITPASTLTRLAAKPLAGTSTPTATVTRRTAKTLTGTTAPAGGLLKQARKTLAGTVAAAASLVVDHIPGGLQVRNWLWQFGPVVEKWQTGSASQKWETGSASQKWETGRPDTP